jgi:thioredoxin 1
LTAPSVGPTLSLARPDRLAPAGADAGRRKGHQQTMTQTNTTATANTTPTATATSTATKREVMEHELSTSEPRPGSAARRSPAGPRTVLSLESDSTLDAVLDPERLTVVDFSATWCGPCRMLEPILDELAQELPAVDFLELDVDRCQQSAIRYGVQAVPTLLVLQHGKVVERMVGLRPKGALAARLRELGAT